MDKNKTNKKQLKGLITSNKMQNTVRVRIDTPTRHPVYGKVINKKKVVFAHTEQEFEVGDEVIIEECRPYSKNIKWIVKEKNGTEGK